jgi:glycosyltransferase involved in cell wall biosynthesis
VPAKPTISACIAVHNGADLLPRALTSMVEQTHPADEILVVDDGSTDDSAKIAAGFPGVRVIEQANGGIGAARKRLVEEARYEWIAFNDHDDWWTQYKLEKLLPYAKDPDATLIYSGAYFVDEDDKVTEAPTDVRADAPRLRHLLPSHSNILVPATLLRRRALLEVGNYRTEMRSGEDTLSFFMLMSKGKVIQVPERLAYIFKRRQSTSSPRRSTYEYERAIYTDHLLPMWDELFGHFPAAEQIEAREIIQSKLAHLESVIGCWYDWEGEHGKAMQFYRSSMKRRPATKGNLYRMMRSAMRLRARPPGLVD